MRKTSAYFRTMYAANARVQLKVREGKQSGMAVGDRELYRITIAALLVALVAGLLLIARGNAQARSDGWYVPIIGIMVYVSIQHMNGY
jgi:uncharacterized membrane protein